MYVTVPAYSRTKQITIEDFLNGNFSFDNNAYAREDMPYTRTFSYEYSLPPTIKKNYNFRAINVWLAGAAHYKSDYDVENMGKYYKHYEIPKRSGGYRPIDDPSEDLSNLKKDLKDFRYFLQNTCHAMYHTSAYAYIENRSTRDERNFHARQQSRWFCYLDFHNFFGSITYEFAKKMIYKVYPFCEIATNPLYAKSKENFEYCLKLCFLNGGLPQGTPISPMLTNLIMIPFDFELSKKLIHHPGQAFYYTRYADDICISSKYDFDPKEIEKIVCDMIKEFKAPFELNTKKTHYCSRSGHNFHLGLMYNKDGAVTVGHKRKDSIKGALTNYALDTKAGKVWHYHDVQILLGKYQYCVSQEKEYFLYIMQRISDKFGIDIYSSMIEQLKRGDI